MTCISIGASIRRKPVIGIVHNPVLDETFTAIAGQGAFLNGTKMPIQHFIVSMYGGTGRQAYFFISLHRYYGRGGIGRVWIRALSGRNRPHAGQNSQAALAQGPEFAILR
jgi:hypothetical protein